MREVPCDKCMTEKVASIYVQNKECSHLSHTHTHFFAFCVYINCFTLNVFIFYELVVPGLFIVAFKKITVL